MLVILHISVVDLAVLHLQLNPMILKVFSNLSDHAILHKFKNKTYKILVKRQFNTIPQKAADAN